MELLTWMEIVGLVGLVMVVSMGKILFPLRDWCLGFSVAVNPLRLFGELISCPMCSGVWIGFSWGWFAEGWSFWSALTLGGFLSLASMFGGILLARGEAWAGSAQRDVKSIGLQDIVEAKLQERAQRLAQKTDEERKVERKIAEGGDLSEDDAHAIADFSDRQSELWFDEQE